MTMKPKSEAITPAADHDAPVLILDSTFSFAGIHCSPYAMLFSRKAADGLTEFVPLSFEDGLTQPLTMLDENPDSRTSTLEHILWHKINRDLPDTTGSEQFLELFVREFRERFGMDSPWATKQLATSIRQSESDSENTRD